jgi:diguanylate cyclase (GGDEF)-like protein/PAS domain S-box-containing protein
MRVVHSGVSSSHVAGRAPKDQVVDHEVEEDAEGAKPASSHAPVLRAIGAGIAGEESIDAMLTALEASGRPAAGVWAIDDEGILVPVPESLDLHGQRLAVVALGHPGTHMVMPESKVPLVLAWDQLLREKRSELQARLVEDPDRVLTINFFDARERYGVFIGVGTEADEEKYEVQLGTKMPELASRFSRARKDEWAVLLEVDEAFTRILGWSPEEVIGNRTLDLIHPDDQELAVDNWVDMLAGNGPGRRVRLRHLHRDGSWVWLEVTNHNLLQDPEHSCVIAEMVDITEEMAAMWAREQLLDRLAETLPLGLLQVDTDARVVYTNDRLYSIVGTSRADTAEEQLATVVDEDRQVVVEAFTGVLTDGIDSDIEVRLRPFGELDKELRYCTLNLRVLTDALGAVTGAIICVADVTESARARDELRKRATYDAVTRCYNRASTMDELEAILALNDTDRRPAVIYIDLDHFKDVNDALGHRAGDEFLLVVAERLHRCVRAEDIVGRIGGDEFLIICPRIASAAEAMSTAERLSSSLRNRIFVEDGNLPSSASIGVAFSDALRVSAETLVAQADTAMYRCKRAGDGTPVLFDESMATAGDTGTWQWPALPDERT